MVARIIHVMRVGDHTIPHGVRVIKVSIFNLEINVREHI